jgi:hypothetical protein
MYIFMFHILKKCILTACIIVYLGNLGTSHDDDRLRAKSILGDNKLKKNEM